MTPWLHVPFPLRRTSPAAFAEGWIIESIEGTRAEGRLDLKDLSLSEGGPTAWLVVVRRLSLREKQPSFQGRKDGRLM
jgi:hypothetical protein